jgi:hypothetical protein
MCGSARTLPPWIPGANVGRPMTIRDLGYKPYEGERLPASHNTVVLLRQAMRRAWSSWLVKLSVFLGLGPLLVFGAIYLVYTFVLARGTNSGSPPFDAGAFVRDLVRWQTWLFVLPVTLGAGAGAIAEDLTFKAFHFYFAKPVTPPQYLAGRVGAVATYAFAVTFVPAVALVVLMTALGPETPELRLERAGLTLPALLQCALVALSTGTLSIAVSSLSKSRALTMSAWILLFVVPHVIAKLVDLVGDFDWLYLGSVPGLLSIIGEALFKTTREDPSPLRWYHAAPVLAALSAGGAWLALERLRRAEIIA